MAEVKERLRVSADMIFRVVTIVVLVFSGLSAEQVISISRRVAAKTDQVSQVVTEVQQQTQAVEDHVEKTRDLVTENHGLLHDHAHLTKEHETMFAHLQPLFADIVQRQKQTRDDIERLTHLADNLHEHEETLTRLLTEHTQLFQDITTQLQALTQAIQAQTATQPQETR